MKTRSCLLIAAGIGIGMSLAVALGRTGTVLSTPPAALLNMAAVLVFGVALRSGVDDAARLQSAGRRTVDVYKKAAVLVLNVLVCFACLELVSSVMVNARSALRNPAEETEVLDPRAASSYYASQDWAAVYWSEFSASRPQKYRPYVLWRRGAFSGMTINIDENGIRSTPGAICRSDSFKVFVLGGSTVWGTGSPDWGTLPAYLQAELQRGSDKPVCVVNFGESAYVSTQSVLTLLFQLQIGNIPDLVISYEGPNDVYSAYQSGRSGAPENLDQLVAAFEGVRTVPQSAIGRLMRSTSLFSVASDLLLKVTYRPEEPPKLLTYETLGVDQKALTAAVVQTYLGNYDAVDGLARKYGFDFRFYWPPYVSIGRKPLTAEEEAIARRVDPALDSLYHSVYRMIAAEASRYPKLSDITGVFDGHSSLLWLDEVHVTPLGNQVLAARIAGTLKASEPAPTAGAARRPDLPVGRSSIDRNK